MAIKKTDYFLDEFQKQDDFLTGNLEWSSEIVLMKTDVHQRCGWRKSVTRIAMAVCILACSQVASLVLHAAQALPTVTLKIGATDVDIQKALDALPDTGGEVVLPAGIFEVHQPIILHRDHQTLRGAGPDTVLRLTDNANCPVIIMGEPVNQPQKTLNDLRVADLFIDGNRQHQQRELWRLQGEGSEIRNNGITIQKVSDSVVEHVTCARNRSGGLVTTLGTTRLTVRDLTAFDNEFDGLACYMTTESLFADLHLYDNPGAGISLDLAFNNNVISNAMLNGNDLGIFMRASRENRFYNVSIHRSHHYGVFMAHSEIQTDQGWGPEPQSECVYNSFTNLIAMNCGSAAFRVNNTTCTNNIIIRARFEDNVKGGLSLARPNIVVVQ